MTISKPREDASTWMSGTYTTDKLRLRQAIVKEKLSTLTETTIEFLAQKVDVKLKDFVGKIMTVHVEQEGSDNGRMITGTCISIEAMGMRDQNDHFVAQVRPWFWLLTLQRNTRVFQNKSVTDIITEVLDAHQLTDYQIKTSDEYEKREYCVQYRETDFDFLSRLMEEEGIYFYFDHSDAFQVNELLVFCDSVSGHKDIDGGTAKYKPRDASDSKTGQTISEWAAAQEVTRGIVTLIDYDFEKPSVRQKEALKKPS
ncbi:type VI secretion system Vgr family protein [Sulfitobacter sediminilitoris]|uniref:type VI secretion system Vgr family protein n=1 Tax=Sulfitobacter sediminilitoris TaxID=2698830 RepID=UPI00360B5443